MGIINILTIAVALAMDAFAVAIAAGLTLKTVTLRQTFRLAWHFGLFQALMPVLGWFLGYSARGYVQQYDHWIAFLLLAFVGGHMIKEACHPDRDARPVKDPSKGWRLILLSVAVSIDAFAVGLSLAMLNVLILKPALIIGVVALLATALGLRLSHLLQKIPHLSQSAEILGGAALILIGLNILREHAVFAAIGKIFF